MSYKIGRKGKVALGSDIISEMGNWVLDGFSVDLLEITAFGDEVKRFDYGLADAGGVSFNGNYDPTDASGQDALNSYCENQIPVTDLRFYVDETSYFAPDLTADSSSAIIITKCKNITFDKAVPGITRNFF